jgi:hypothetical protein
VDRTGSGLYLLNRFGIIGVEPLVSTMVTDPYNMFKSHKLVERIW